MLNSVRPTAGIALLLCLFLSLPASASLFLSYDADEDTNDDATWVDEVGTNQTTAGKLDYGLSGLFSYGAASANTRAGITNAFNFTGGKGNYAGNIQNDSQDNITDSDASIEVCFKPADLMRQEILIEYGGSTDGSSITLNGKMLQFVTKDGGASTGLTADLTGLTGDFIQVVGVIDLSGTNHLYINGAEVGTGAANSGTDWAGGNGNDGLAGIGSTQVGGDGGAFGALSGYGNFDGEIAIVNVYNTALSDAEVLTAFEAEAVPEPSSIALLIGDVAAMAFGLRRRCC